MTDTLFALVSNYGLWVVAASVFLSCIALPIPASVLMLGAGAFAASGDFMLWQVLAVSWIAAMIGDQTGFQIGRAGGATLIARLQKPPIAGAGDRAGAGHGAAPWRDRRVPVALAVLALGALM